MRDAIRFLYNGEVIEVNDFDPTTTVLQYLRRHLRRTGTKEGCAEGDCGACTVAIGELDGDKISYRAINACIAFLTTIDGKELVTVECLAKNGALHPVQRALVSEHGSQCGFCTPGFVMSLFTHYESQGATDSQTLCDKLAGNLCRCTGYGPILNAGKKMFEYPQAPNQSANEASIATLKQFENDDALTLAYSDSVGDMTYFAPRTINQLLEILNEHPEATIIAGATDVGLWVTKHHKRLDVIVSLHRVRELNYIHSDKGTIQIGALCSYADAHKALGNWHPDFGEVIRRIGSTQIRNSGTIGGNIANGSPIGDSMPILIAGNATLHLRSLNDQRAIPLEEFFIEYGKQDLRDGEIVEQISLPALSDNSYFRAYKISKRFDQDISALCGAFKFTLDGGAVKDARIAFGGMASTPKRASNCEDVLTGAQWNEETIENAAATLAQDFAPISDMRASADYRLATAQNLLRKAYYEHSESTATRVLENYGGIT